MTKKLGARRRVVVAPEVMEPRDKDDLTPNRIDKASVNATLVARPSAVPNVRLKPHIGVMFSDAYTIVHNELRAMRIRTEAGEVLAAGDVVKMSKLTESLTRLAREEREQAKVDDPTKLDDATLQAELKALLNGESDDTV